MIRATAMAGLACLLSLGLAACEQEGPLERAGESIDESVEDVREGAEDAAEEIE